MHSKICSFIILFISFTLFATAQKKDMSNKGYKIGDTITDFNLKNIDGNFKKLVDYKNDKGIIIIFTCNHCPYSVAYEDRIIALHNKYQKLGYPVVAINPNDAKTYPIDSYENMQERAQDKAFPFDYLHDESQVVAKQFGATNTPHVFIVSNHFPYFKVEYIGAIDDNSHEPQSVQTKYAENAVDDLLKGKAVFMNKTKAIGCGIKWK